MTSRSVFLLFLLTHLMAPGSVQGETFSNLQTLIGDLFSNYTPDIRSFEDVSQPTYVSAALSLVSIKELNEISQSLEFSASFVFGWTDPRLQWSTAAYNSTQYFAYPQEKLWIPDITIVNSVETLKELGFDRNYLYVLYDGSVLWLPGGVYKTSCDIDVTYYPFDSQTCSVVLSTLVSRDFEISLYASVTEATSLSLFTASGTWDLVSFTATDNNDETDKSSVVFSLRLQRLRTYYVVAIVIPVLFLSLTATLVFALPADSGEKMGTSITVLLSFAVYLTIVSDQMPQTSSSVSILSLYLSVLLGQTALGVVLSVWILNLHHRDDTKQPAGPTTCTVAFHLQRLICKRPWRDGVTPAVHLQDDNGQKDTPSNPAVSLFPSDHTDTSKHLQKKEIPTFYLQSKGTSLMPSDLAGHVTGPGVPPVSSVTMPWKEIAFTFDRFLFWVFSFFLIVVSFVFLTILAVE